MSCAVAGWAPTACNTLSCWCCSYACCRKIIRQYSAQICEKGCARIVSNSYRFTSCWMQTRASGVGRVIWASSSTTNWATVFAFLLFFGYEYVMNLLYKPSNILKPTMLCRNPNNAQQACVVDGRGCDYAVADQRILRGQHYLALQAWRAVAQGALARSSLQRRARGFDGTRWDS